jgi:DNA topoisomerase IA
MAKNYKLNNEEKEYIKARFKKEDVSDIATALDRTETIITKYIEELKSQEPDEPISTSSLFAKNKTAFVMTPDASAALDQVNPAKSVKGRFDAKCIHKIHKNKK